MTADKSRTTSPTPGSVAHFAQIRADAEAQVLAILQALTGVTGLDLRGVTVHTVATTTHHHRDTPQVIPVAVRIDLTV